MNQSHPVEMKSSPKKEFLTETEQIFNAVGPTCIAGACFPLVVFVIPMLISLVGAWSNQSVFNSLAENFVTIIGGTAFVAGFGGPIGWLYSMIVAFLMASIVSLFHWSTTERFHPRFLVQVVGGATGFWCVGACFGSPGYPFWLVVGFACLAMLMGQYAAAKHYRRSHGNYQRKSRPDWLQFGIKEMMIAVTWVAVICAVLSLLPTVVPGFVAWVVAQSLSLLAGEGIRRFSWHG